MLGLELLGDLGLFDLPLQVSTRIVDEQIPCQLHGDRRSTFLDRSGLEVGDGCSCDALQVNSSVVIEALILDGYRGVAEVVAHLVCRYRCACFVGLDVPKPRSVRCEDDRVGALVYRPQVVGSGCLRGDAHRVEPEKEEYAKAGSPEDDEGRHGWITFSAGATMSPA